MRRDAIQYAQFSILSAEDIRKFSVCEITLPASGSSDNRQNTPYDVRMGSLENDEKCGTCGYDNTICPGHCGHITLACPVYNVICLPHTIKILQSVCSECGRPRILPQFAKSSDLKCYAEKGKKVYKCPWEDCGSPLYGFVELKDREVGRFYKDPKSAATPFSAGEALAVLKKISPETASLFGIGNNLSRNPAFITPEGKHRHAHHPKDFIITVLPVIPPAARPYIVKDGQICDDDLTEKYNTILKLNTKCREHANGVTKKTKTGKVTAKVENKEKIAVELRNNIWSLMIRDSESKQSTTGRHHKSIEERIGKKEGQIQTNISGKRSDYTARDVIMGGGILLKAGEFGVPYCVSSGVTYPEIVVPWNKRVLQDLVKKGFVNKITRKENGRVNTIRLSDFPDKGCDFTLKVGDVVRRHMMDGEGWYDMFVANRQPSLRTESMKGYKVKSIEGNAFRLPEMYTRSYGADFDGDEMNLHVFQSTGANAECRILLRSPIHLVTAQRNAPVDGVVQDGLVGALLLTNTWNDGETYMKVDLFRKIVHEAGLKLTPSFFKRASKYYPDYVSETDFIEDTTIIPGKLAFSVLFPETLRYKVETGINSNYPIVKISYGIIKPDSGPMCSKIIGSKHLSITHKLWKEYSPDIAEEFLASVQQFTNRWLPHHGFSIGVKDCTNTVPELIAKTFAEVQSRVNAILKRCGGTPNQEDEYEIIATLNRVMGIAHKIGNEGMTGGEKNALNVMRQAGAKGSVVNLTQITAAVTQQILDGGRVQLGVCGGTRSLSHFAKGDHSADAKGMIFECYLGGYGPTASLFHAMSGRKGIISTGVKTADTGYIQKRIGKKVEDYSVWIDGSVRDSNGKIVQFLYGDDGMDAKKLYNVKGVNYPFCVNPQNIADQLNARFVLDGGAGKKRNLSQAEIRLLVDNFIHAGQPYQKSKIIQNQTKILRKNVSRLLETTKIYEVCIPELCSEIRRVIECSKAQYGDMVGLVAASSLGEPTTQMVLNVFHTAGVAGKDVSLGVPRFNEILNATKSDKQKKPSCTIYFTEEHHQKSEGEMLKFAKKTFEESFVSGVLKNSELFIVGEIDPERWSPASPIGYKIYEEEWWVGLHSELHGKNQEPREWVLMLNFDIGKLCDRSLTIMEIAKSITDTSEGRFTAVYSPTLEGKIEIRCDFDHDSWEESINKLIEAQPELINRTNVAYFIMRDVCLEFVKGIFVSGIKGISKVFVRKVDDEWVADVALARATQISAHKRFLDILTHPDVDSSRTVCDDMHTLNAVFGIEATRKFLIQEKDRIISFDGTYVNKRHTQILTDSMVNVGEITSVRRDGIPRSVGPIAKMMFEDSVPNVIHSSVFGEMDNKTSISASVMLGTFSSVGTGAVTVVSSESVRRSEIVSSPKHIQIPTRVRKDRDTILI